MENLKLITEGNLRNVGEYYRKTFLNEISKKFKLRKNGKKYARRGKFERKLEEVREKYVRKKEKFGREA